MITDQSVIRDIPGAYDVAVCGADKIPLSDFGTMAPRTLFDEPLHIELEVRTQGEVTGIVSRDGVYVCMFQHARLVTPGMKVTLTAGTGPGLPPSQKGMGGFDPL